MSLLLEMLWKRNLLSPSEVNSSAIKINEHENIVAALVEKHPHVTEDEILRILSEEFDVPFEELSNEMIESSAIGYVDYDLAKKYCVCPVKMKNNELHIAVNDIMNVQRLDMLRFITGMK